MPDHTILIIDYEPRSIAAMTRPLEAAGFRVEVAGDGLAGLAAFEQHAPALVLIEAMLPKKHGFEVCQEIKKTAHGQRTPVIVTTAVYRGRKYRTQAMHIHGCDEYLEKPFTEDQLIQVVGRLLPELVDTSISKGTTQTATQSEAATQSAVATPPALPASTGPDVAPAAEGTGAFASIVGDLTEEEISATLDAVLPGELFGDDGGETPGVEATVEPHVAEPPENREPVMLGDELAGMFDPEPGASPTEMSAAVPADVEIETDAETATQTEADRLEEAVLDAALPVESEPEAADPVPGIEPTEGEAEETDTQVVAFDADRGRKSRRRKGKGKKKRRGARAKAQAAAQEASQPAEPAIESSAESVPAASVDADQAPQPEVPLLAQALDAAAEAISDETPPEPKSKLWMGVAALLIVGAAVGAFFVFGDRGDRDSVAAIPPSPDRSFEPDAPRVAGVEGTAVAVPGALETLDATEPAPERPSDSGETSIPGDLGAESTPVADRPPAEESVPARSEPERPKPEATVAAVVDAPAPETVAPAVTDTAALRPEAVVQDEPALDDVIEEAVADEPDTIEPAAAAVPPAEDLPVLEPAADPDPQPATPPPPVPEVVSEPELEPETPAEPAPVVKAARGDLVMLHEADQAPSIANRTSPSYPTAARRRRQEGTVVINVLIDENGRVEEVELIRGVAADLDRAAMNAVRSWTYKPAVKDGVRVKVWKPEKLTFKL